MKKTGRGFTLIEMLIVIVVISILVLIVVPRLFRGVTRTKPHAPTMQQQADNLSVAIVKFYDDNGDWPFKLANLNLQPSKWDLPPIGGTGKRIDPKRWKGPYLPKSSVPKDFHGELEYVDADSLVWHVEYDHTKGSIALWHFDPPNSTTYIRPKKS